MLVELMQKAKERNLWNLFLPVDTCILKARTRTCRGSSPRLASCRAQRQLPRILCTAHLATALTLLPLITCVHSAALVDGKYGAGLTNLQYADLCEIQGTSIHGEMAAQATNCTSPDTGNMETIARFGTEEQKERWLKPLLEGKIRSCFAMTEPDVASSDATNISIDIQKDGSDYVVNGRKWWCTGAGSLHTQIMILMGKTDPTNASIHKQQSMLLVPMDTPGIRLVRPLTVFGDDDAPKGHMEIAFENCRGECHVAQCHRGT